MKDKHWKRAHKLIIEALKRDGYTGSLKYYGKDAPKMPNVLCV